MRRTYIAGMAFVCVSLLVAVAAATATITPPTPIQHVVVIYQENHSFDNVLGQLCIQDSRCDGAASGRLPHGTSIMLWPASDKVVGVNHGVSSQQTAMHGGAMDGFANIPG